MGDSCHSEFFRLLTLDPKLSTFCSAVGEGLLHPGQTSGKTAVSSISGAKSGALDAPADDLTMIAAHWHDLTDHQRASIMGIVRRAAGTKGAKR